MPVGLAAVYGSYFGGALGVILLAVLGLLIADELQRLNALKGVLSLVINLAGVAVFLVTGQVAWLAAALLAVGAYLGATLGVKAGPPAAGPDGARVRRRHRVWWSGSPCSSPR